MGKKLQISQAVNLEDLKVQHRQEKNPLIRDRVLMLIQIYQGHTTRQVAQMLNVSKGTVSLWVHRFNATGFEGLLDQPRGGRPPKVNYQALKLALKSSPQNFGYPHQVWHPALVQIYLREHQQLSINKTHVYWIIKRLGFVLRVPRPFSRKSNPQQVDQFKKNENYHSPSSFKPTGRSR